MPQGGPEGRGSSWRVLDPQPYSSFGNDPSERVDWEPRRESSSVGRACRVREWMSRRPVSAGREGKEGHDAVASTSSGMPGAEVGSSECKIIPGKEKRGC